MISGLPSWQSRPLPTPSARKTAANRANAQRSTGPRSAAGKAKAARNAERHGLTIPIARDPSLQAEVLSLPEQIVTSYGSATTLELAISVVEAQIAFGTSGTA